MTLVYRNQELVECTVSCKLTIDRVFYWEFQLVKVLYYFHRRLGLELVLDGSLEVAVEDPDKQLLDQVFYSTVALMSLELEDSPNGGILVVLVACRFHRLVGFQRTEEEDMAVAY